MDGFLGDLLGLSSTDDDSNDDPGDPDFQPTGNIFVHSYLIILGEGKHV